MLPAAVHFVGDGATFGVPQPLAAPQRNALEAAQGLLLRVERLDYDLVLERLPWTLSWIKLPWSEVPLAVEW